MSETTRDPIAEAHRHWVARGWTDAASGMPAVTTIVRVHQLLIARIDAALQSYHLTFARFEVLRRLSFTRRGELPMGKLGERLQVHPASVTNAVSRLEEHGPVRRVAHPRNNRSTLARILPAGKKLLGPATKALNVVLEDLGLTTEELDRLVEYLAPIRQSGGDDAAVRLSGVENRNQVVAL